MNKLKQLIKSTIRQHLIENYKHETVEDFIERFEQTNVNPDFLINHFKIPNFRLELTHDGNVEQKVCGFSLSNKCETNTFNFIKNMVQLNNHKYFPVSGWAFLENTTYFEHFWIYDNSKDIFIDVTPMEQYIPYAYGGVINFNINDDILNADKYNEIPFLLGKAAYSLYKNYRTNKPLNITKKEKKDIFHFIHKNEKYAELSEFIIDNNIQDIIELEKFLPKLKDKLYSTRNNRDWDYYHNLINQIENIKL